VELETGRRLQQCTRGGQTDDAASDYCNATHRGSGTGRVVLHACLQRLRQLARNRLPIDYSLDLFLVQLELLALEHLQKNTIPVGAHEQSSCARIDGVVAENDGAQPLDQSLPGTGVGQWIHSALEQKQERTLFATDQAGQP
jgi:hypothetical protein